LKSLAWDDGEATRRECDRGSVVRTSIQGRDQAAHVTRTEDLERELTTIVRSDRELDAPADHDVRGEARIPIMEQDVSLRESTTNTQLCERTARRVILRVQEEYSWQYFKELLHGGVSHGLPDDAS
jgi:hypothetical protein